jgi:hypothetical protein
MRFKACIGIHSRLVFWFILCTETTLDNPDFEQCDENSKITIEYHLYVFDDRNHDLEFVQHCFKLH